MSHTLSGPGLEWGSTAHFPSPCLCVCVCVLVCECAESAFLPAFLSQHPPHGIGEEMIAGHTSEQEVLVITWLLGSQLSLSTALCYRFPFNYSLCLISYFSSAGKSSFSPWLPAESSFRIFKAGILYSHFTLHMSQTPCKAVCTYRAPFLSISL